MEPLWDIYQEHLEEAGFLYTQWERARGSPHLALRDVAAGLEERLRAHVDGLAAGGPEVMQRMLLPALGDDSLDPEVTWAAAFALLEGGLEGAADAVLEALAGASEAPERLAALDRAVELSSAPLEGRLRPLLQPEKPALAAAVLRALAARGVALGDRLDDFIASDSPEPSAAALDQVWEEPSLHRRELVERALESGSVLVRKAALRAGLRMRLRAAWEACARQPASGESLVALAMGGSEEDVARVEALLADEALRTEALFALGFSGRVRAVDASLTWLGDKKVGHLAGEVFSSITGVAIEGPLKAEREEEKEEGEGELAEGLAANLDPGPEGDLPRPDAEAVKKLWEKQRPVMRAELRYLGGEPVTASRLAAALRDGPMRRRPPLALELAVRTQSAPVDLGRWASRQLADASAGFRHFEERPFKVFFSR